MNLYGEISKVDPQDDGTIKVYGFASTAAEDSQGETVLPDAIKAALPDYMKFGAVREMHQPLAAGTAIEASVQDDGRTWFGAHVVDPIAVKKVQTGVYKGFSIGGKVTERDTLNRTIIKGIRLTEISLVDRPANPEAVFTMYKAEGADMNQEATASEEATIATETEGPAVLTERDAAKSAALDGLKKYLGEEVWDAQRALDALAALTDLLRNELWEAEDGDGEPPEQVAALREAIARLKAFIVSEIQENNDEGAAPADDAVAQAEPIADLEKAGKEISAKNSEHLGAIHKAASDIATRCAKMMGAADAAAVDDADKAEAPDDLAKADLAKVQAEATDLRKSLDTVTAERDTLAKAKAEWEAQPAPAKGAVRVIEKSADTGASEPSAIDNLQKSLEKMSPEQQAQAVLKFTLKHGGKILPV